jgi:uncharacterized protein (DUF2164 family)/transposase
MGFVQIVATKEDRQQALLSIQRYFEQNMEEKIGNIAASELLGFFLEEVGSSIYNKGVRAPKRGFRPEYQSLTSRFTKKSFRNGASTTNRRSPRSSPRMATPARTGHMCQEVRFHLSRAARAKRASPNPSLNDRTRYGRPVRSNVKRLLQILVITSMYNIQYIYVSYIRDNYGYC